MGAEKADWRQMLQRRDAESRKPCEALRSTRLLEIGLATP